MGYFDSFRFKLPFDSTDPNEWADAIELRCMLFEDGSITLNQIQTVIESEVENPKNKKLPDFSKTSGKKTFDKELRLRAERHSTKQNLEAAQEDTDEGQNIPVEEEPLPQEDVQNTSLLFLFRFLAERATVFGKAYPFHFPGPVVGQKIAVVPKAVRTDKQQLYLALLLNCGQRHVDKSTQTKLGHLFEMGCEPLFGKVVPSCTTKALFGAGAEVENPVFSGNLKERITNLAIKLKVHPGKNLEDRPWEYSAGDRGADLLAWFSFPGDHADARPFYIAQCAAGDNWRGKQNDAGRTKWERKLHPLPPYIPFLFICRSHRSVNGTWNSIDEVESHIGLFDRLRMLVFLDEHEIKTCLITYKNLLAEAEVYTITDLIE